MFTCRAQDGEGGRGRQTEAPASTEFEVWEKNSEQREKRRRVSLPGNLGH